MTAVRNRILLGAGAAAVAAAITATVQLAYRHDMRAAWRRLAATERKHVTTPFGMMEYAECGAGQPVLVSHGILHGCDGGLLSVRDTMPGRRIIAPSRFGYLGSELSIGATPASQADAYAALLDHLDLASVDVVGMSAGSTAALEFALRHRDRTNHLVLLSANFPGGPTVLAPPSCVKLLYADLPMWAMKKVARLQVARLMGVPAGFPKTREQAQRMDEFVESIFPLGPRASGAVCDAYLSNPEVNDVPIEKITVPTIIIHAMDDPLCPFASAEKAARRIPGCTLVALESGGHLGLGQDERTRAALDHFLAVPMVA